MEISGICNIHHWLSWMDAHVYWWSWLFSRAIGSSWPTVICLWVGCPSWINWLNSYKPGVLHQIPTSGSGSAVVLIQTSPSQYSRLESKWPPSLLR